MYEDGIIKSERILQKAYYKALKKELKIYLQKQGRGEQYSLYKLFIWAKFFYSLDDCASIDTSAFIKDLIENKTLIYDIATSENFTKLMRKEIDNFYGYTKDDLMFYDSYFAIFPRQKKNLELKDMKGVILRKNKK